jgi:formylglycine-generating enzyme required for sulfatase activity
MAYPLLFYPFTLFRGSPEGLAPLVAAKRRALRGGSWLNLPQDCRSANRGRNSPDFRDYDGGFRVVVSAGVD